MNIACSDLVVHEVRCTGYVNLVLRHRLRAGLRHRAFITAVDVNDSSNSVDSMVKRGAVTVRTCVPP